MLHITEHTGRGIPRITGIYGRDSITFKENSITVTIPYDRLGDEVYAQDMVTISPVDIRDAPVNVQDEIENVQVMGLDARDNVQDNMQETLSNPDKILILCEKPKSIIELANLLGYKDRRSVRKLLNPLLEIGRIAMTIPDKPNSRNQKYITIK